MDDATDPTHGTLVILSGVDYAGTDAARRGASRFAAFPRCPIAVFLETSVG